MFSWLSSLVSGGRGQEGVAEVSKFKIWVRTTTGKKIRLAVSKDDTVETIKQAVENAEGYPIRDQKLIYAGKQLEDHRDLWCYGIEEEATIQLIVRSRQTVNQDDMLKDSRYDAPLNNSSHDDVSKYSSHGSRETIRRHHERLERPSKDSRPKPRGQATSSRLQARRSPGDIDLLPEQQFDDDEYMLNPVSYYDNLDNLEKTVVERSEYYFSAGRYEPTVSHIENADAMYASSRCSLDVWRCFAHYFASKPSSDASAAMSLGKSYMILCQLLDALDNLTKKRFCNNAFTILIYRPIEDQAIAEMVEVKSAAILDFHDAIGDTILAVFGSGQPLPEQATTEHMAQTLTPALQDLMKTLGIQSAEQIPESDILHFCRVLTLILDLGLASYTGSHGTRFDLDYLGLDQPEILVVAAQERRIGFRFSLQNLACLDQFLSGQQVWALQPLWTELGDVPNSTTPLSILTSIQGLADTWGPLWTIPAGQDFPDYLKQINVGTGLICRTESSANFQIQNSVPCHWFTSHELAPTWPPSVDDPYSKLIHRNQKLLIGGLPTSCLETSKTCSYNLDDLERDYGLCMTPLGTNASSWVYEERQVGFSASQYIGITVLGTQKKLPCITQKQAIWNKWTNQPTRANPRILNSYLGVEISHCTGNARRVELRQIFTMKPVQALLMRQFPDWKSSDFGPMLQLAFHSPSDITIEEVWVTYYKSRTIMAEMICCVLELLEKTGMSKAGFSAAFLNQQREFSVPLPPRLNRWTEFLEDSHLTAVYAIINQKCFTGHEQFTASCNSTTTQSPNGFTVFETQIAVPDLKRARDKIWLHQRGFLQQVSTTTDGVHIATWESGKARELGSKLGKFLRSKEAPLLSREVQESGELGGQHVQVLVKSTVPSYGGLPSKRNSQTKAGAAEKITDFGGSLEIGMPIHEPLVLLEVGARQQDTR